MTRLNLKAIEERVKPLGGRASYDRTFVFELLQAYGRSSSTVARLRGGSLNVADDPDTEVAQKGIVYFKTTEQDPLLVIDTLRTSPTVVRYTTRFVIVTDFTQLLAVDTKTGETLSIAIWDIDKHFIFFLPWAGMEKAQVVAEAHADVKAAERMAKLFDELLTINSGLRATELGRHGLNVFFTRLLFCFFAEDTGIFVDNQFTNAVEALTQTDGSDLHNFLADLYVALDTEDPRSKPPHFARFPYVNGRLFTVEAHHRVPVFNRKARDLLLEMGRLRWSEINPDIFGSMFQAVVTPGQRADLGQHYTSVPNILKTIEPLFLDDLKDEFDAGYDSVRKLEALHGRIADIKVFDPACGSGNFLVIAYKELRRLEHAILERVGDLRSHHVLFADSRISIEHFYGIEIDDFAVEVAILSLWIAKHQMNREAGEKFRVNLPLIPLKTSGQIHQGNAIRDSWLDVCPNDGEQEIYLISNPPYLGSRHQSPSHKDDLKQVTPQFRSLDYVSAWFIKGAAYIEGSAAELAFVSTNSITQGEQVSLLWPSIFDRDLEIGYAYTSFRWSNQARGSAGVTCVVVNLRNRQEADHTLFTDGLAKSAKYINAYLAEGNDIWLSRRTRPLSPSLPRVGFGSMPNDGGNLILSDTERAKLLTAHPEADKYLLKYCGSEEYISGKSRWCFYIPDVELTDARAIPEIAERLDRVVAHRAKSTEKSTRAMAARPNHFYFSAHRDGVALLIPSVSSERRAYIPLGFVDDHTMVSNRAYVTYDAQLWLAGLLESAMHMSWVRAVAGRLETRLNYSNTIVFNNFPVPTMSVVERDLLTQTTLRIFDVREYHSERTLAELYDPDLMPSDLRLAHQQNDDLVDSIYQEGGFDMDEERLSHLFALYENMAKDEQRK